MIAKAENTPLDKVRVLQRKLYLAAKTNPKRKFGMLYDKVCREDVLRAAYAQVKANKGAPGIDQRTLEMIEKEVGVGTFLNELRAKLVAKRYKPLPVRRVFIPKADGTQRPLGIPVIADRVVQAAVKMAIEPLFEAVFKDLSYGFRPRKNAHQALREVYKWLNFKCHWVVDADLKSYFDTIPHDKLLLSVRSKVADRSVVKLISMWLKAGVMEETGVRTETTGTPQGGVISPLLANLYLHWLDQTWERKEFGKHPHDAHIVRYADDFVILCKERPEFYLEQAKQVLDRLGLTLNAKKTRILNVEAEPFDFLGHRFTVRPSKKTGKQNTFYYPSPKAMTSVKYARDWSAAEQDFQRAIRLNPNDADTHHAHAEHLPNTGRAEGAIAEMERARELDPLSLPINGTLGRVYRDARRNEEADVQCRKTVELDPDFALGHWCLGVTDVAEKRYTEAITEMQRANALGAAPLYAWGLGYAYAVSGDRIRAKAIIESLKRRPDNVYMPAYFIASIYGALDEKDLAFAWLQRAYATRDPQLNYLLLDPFMDPLRSDARFDALVQQVGFPH